MSPVKTDLDTPVCWLCLSGRISCRMANFQSHVFIAYTWQRQISSPLNVESSANRRKHVRECRRDDMLSKRIEGLRYVPSIVFAFIQYSLTVEPNGLYSGNLSNDFDLPARPLSQSGARAGRMSLHCAISPLFILHIRIAGLFSIEASYCTRGNWLLVSSGRIDQRCTRIDGKVS